MTGWAGESDDSKEQNPQNYVAHNSQIPRAQNNLCMTERNNSNINGRMEQMKVHRCDQKSSTKIHEWNALF